jgi:lipopolysaccharide heptosyltransferase II
MGAPGKYSRFGSRERRRRDITKTPSGDFVKILQVLPALDVGGVERGVIDMVRALKRYGHDSVVISSGGPLVNELKKLGIPHYELPVHRKSIFSLALVERIAEIIRKEYVDIVHARSRVPAWLAWLAARKTGVPFVTTCHGYYSPHALSRVMGWGRRVIVPSRIIGRHMIDHFGVSPDKIRLIPRGVDLRQFFPGAGGSGKETEGSKRVFKILNIGRLSPIKGHLEFLNAVHLLRRRVSPLEVSLVGAEGKGKHKYTDLLRKTIGQLGLDSCVRLLGTRRDVPELLREADLLVLSTLVPEAFGRVIVEAGAVGVPVIATRLGGVLDIIDDDREGLLVAPGDSEAMAEAMEKILLDPERARRYAACLAEKVRDRFTVEHMTEKTLEVYAELKKTKKILVIKLGAMGDLILIVPSLRMLRARYPDAFLSLIVDKRIAPVVSNVPYLDEIIPVDREKISRVPYLLKLAKKIRKDEFDLSVDFQNSKWTHLLAFLAGIGMRYGFRRGPFGFLLNRPDRTFEVKEPPVHHQFRILSKLGVRKLDDRLELWPDAESEIRIGKMMDEWSGDRASKTIGLVLGASPQWQSKRWPADYFRELARRLTGERGYRVVLIGTSEDASLGEGFETGQGQGAILNLLGKTSARDLISLFKRLDLVVSGDTAPLHVAAAAQTKIVALFGPTDPRRHMPATGGAAVLCRSLACQPCYRGVCRLEDPLVCLKQISVAEVFDAVERQLAVPS